MGRVRRSRFVLHIMYWPSIRGATGRASGRIRATRGTGSSKTWQPSSMNWGLSRFVLAGLSMGGWHSLLYTAEHPDRVERIVIVDIAPESSDAYKEQAGDRPPTPMTFSNFDDAVESMRQGNPWATEARLRQDAEDKMRQREDGKWTWKADSSLFNMTLPDMTDLGPIGRYWKAVETIPCPILEVRGTESKLVSDETVRRIEKVGKDCRSADVAGAGHVVTVDKPQEFITATSEFLGIG